MTDEQKPENANGADEILEPLEVKPKYGISIFMLENDQVLVQTHGEPAPTMSQLYALLCERHAWLQANITALAVMHTLEQRAAKAARPQIVPAGGVVLPRKPQ